MIVDGDTVRLSPMEWRTRRHADFDATGVVQAVFFLRGRLMAAEVMWDAIGMPPIVNINSLERVCDA